MGKAVGIDLGTTYSVVAYVDADGRPTVIPGLGGKSITPSVVYFGERETLVGDQAKERQLAGAQDVASFFKRDMGEPGIVLAFHGRDYTPVDLSALVLANLKTAAERFLGESVRDAVITTPAYFTHTQRGATMAAGAQADLNVLAIISEPTAAALAYGLRPGASGQTVMVYDLGGGTFDISLVRIEERELRVIATAGDHHLGGRDWDDRVVAYLQAEFQNEFGVDLVGDDFNQLLVQAENLKRALTVRESATAQAQADGYTGTYQMTRAQLEDISRDLLERTAALTERTLEEAHLKWTDLAGVLPVGGSTRMPMVREYIQRMSQKPPMGGVNPDEAVGLGAAIKASMEMAASRGTGATPAAGAPPRYFLMHVRDVVAHSLGMIAESEDRTRYLNSIIVKRNIEVPASVMRPYVHTLRRSGDNRMEVFITQGESDDPQECAYLGLYAVTGFSASSEKNAVVEVTYSYDQNSLVKVSAVEHATGRPLQVTVEPLPPDVPARFLRAPSESRGRRHATVYLAFDLSGSMYGDPLAQAKQAAEAFVSNCDLTTTSVGVIEFSDTVNTTLHASQDANQITRFIHNMREGATGGGNAGQPFTEIHTLLSQVGRQTLKQASGSGQAKGDISMAGQPGTAISRRDQPAQPMQRVLDGARRALTGGARGDEGADMARYGIVLTDGVWDDQRRAIDEAKGCHADGIEIIAIGFGGADDTFLKQVASSTEQGFFTDLGKLTEAFTTIAQELTEADGDDGKRVGSGLARLR